MSPRLWNVGPSAILLLAMVFSLTAASADFVFGAGPAFRRAARAKPFVVHRAKPARKRALGGGILIRDRVLDAGHITVQQIIVIPSQEPEKPKSKPVYVPPHWVDTEHGVQLLVPGAWVENQHPPVK